MIDAVGQTAERDVRPRCAHHQVGDFGEVRLLWVAHPVQTGAVCHAVPHAAPAHVFESGGGYKYNTMPFVSHAINSKPMWVLLLRFCHPLTAFRTYWPFRPNVFQLEHVCGGSDVPVNDSGWGELQRKWALSVQLYIVRVNLSQRSLSGNVFETGDHQAITARTHELARALQHNNISRMLRRLCAHIMNEIASLDGVVGRAGLMLSDKEFRDSVVSGMSASVRWYFNFDCMPACVFGSGFVVVAGPVLVRSNFGAGLNGNRYRIYLRILVVCGAFGFTLHAVLRLQSISCGWRRWS